jgi:inosose dehydratase
MYRPLGTGDVNAIVSVLGRRGYQGWYVLEQDTILTGEPLGKDRSRTCGRALSTFGQC